MRGMGGRCRGYIFDKFGFGMARRSDIVVFDSKVLSVARMVVCR